LHLGLAATIHFAKIAGAEKAIRFECGGDFFRHAKITRESICVGIAPADFTCTKRQTEFACETWPRSKQRLTDSSSRKIGVRSNGAPLLRFESFFLA